jgi:hypothetical protein
MTPFIFHTHQAVSCSKFIKNYIQGQKHFKHNDLILLPYHCKEINHTNRLITGNFIYPMWKPFERTILSKGGHFTHSYVKMHQISMEITPNPSMFKDYHIFGQGYLHTNKVRVCEATLVPNSILFFQLHRNVAKPLIDHQFI